jgi:hypothetical protein
VAPLFGNKEEKAAKEAAAASESARLVALPVEDLAAEIMPAFGLDGAFHSGHRSGPVEVCKWLLAPYSGSSKYTQPVLGPTIESLQALEHAGLVEGRNFGSNGRASSYDATRLGETALAENSVRQKLSPASGA